jgi:GTP-binding protein HflX
MEEQIAAVEEVLEEIDAGDKQVITALNKVDNLDREGDSVALRLAEAEAEYPNAVVLSALTGEGIHEFLGRVDEVLRKRMVYVDVLIPYARSELVGLVHEHGYLELEEHNEEGTHLVGWLPVQLAGRMAGFDSAADE